jgi:hypothetical protein
MLGALPFEEAGHVGCGVILLPDSATPVVDQDVESQLYDLRELAAQRGFEVVHEYEDRGVCGKKARRPGP